MFFLRDYALPVTLTFGVRMNNALRAAMITWFQQLPAIVVTLLPRDQLSRLFIHICGQVASSSACVRLVAAVMTNQRLRLFVSQSHAATRPGIGRPPAIGLHGGALSEEGRTALDVCRVVGSTLPPVYHPDRVVVIDKFPITRHG